MLAQVSLPSRFVASATAAPRQAVVDEPARIEDARALVRLRGGRGPVELVVGTEATGDVRVAAHARDSFSQRVQAQLAFHAVASGRAVDVAADELFVFDIQVVEMLPDAPGPNDALYLYGVMRGPYPAAPDAPVASVDGQLTVTRADLLAGLIDGAGNAFAYAPEPRGSRCVHALLPGERADVIEAGRGVVLALPLAPAWTLDAIVSNDLVSAQMLYDVLAALRADLGISEPALPVPSRALVEHNLVAAGWRIEGNQAVRAKNKSLLGSLFGGDVERKELPREGSLDELVAEAKAVLARVPGVPSAELIALQRGRVRSPAVPSPRPPSSPPPAPTPRAATPAPPPSAAPRPRVEAPRSEWMKDFVDAHRVPAREPPRVTVPARAVAPDATPDWMEDFGDTGTDEKPGDDAAPAPPVVPARDWSKDFE